MAAAKKAAAKKRKPKSQRTKRRGARSAPHRFTADKKEIFLQSLSESGCVLDACEDAGISARTAYDHKNKDPDFAEAWEHADYIGSESLLAECRRRAMNGSDTLLIFLTKGKRHEYKDRLQVDANVNGRLTIQRVTFSGKRDDHTDTK